MSLHPPLNNYSYFSSDVLKTHVCTFGSAGTLVPSAERRAVGLLRYRRCSCSVLASLAVQLGNVAANDRF